MGTKAGTVDTALRSSSTSSDASVVGERDDLAFGRRRRSVMAWYVVLFAVLLLSGVGGVSLGPVTIPAGRVWGVVGHELFGSVVPESWTASERNIVWLIRVPRVLLAMLVGAGLSASGVVLQALVRNVLADPYLLGVASGASTGAAVTILLGVGVGALGASSLSTSAFVGALLAMVLVFAVARLGGQVTSIRMVLSGLAVAYVFSALTSLLVMASDSPQGAQAVLFWLLGGLNHARWSALPVTSVVVLGSVAVFVMWGRKLDALAIGDETARTLGISPARLRTALFVVVSLCVGAVVAVAGVIGFVGLIVPHFARRLVGAEHRHLLGVSALLGAIFLVWADVVARVLLAPQEIPLGIVTSLVGTPFLVLLVHRFHPTPS